MIQGSLIAFLIIAGPILLAIFVIATISWAYEMLHSLTRIADALEKHHDAQ